MTLMVAVTGLLCKRCVARADWMSCISTTYVNALLTPRFGPASAVDARMKNELPFSVYFPSALVVLLRRLNNIHYFCLSYRRYALDILSSHLSHRSTVFNSARWRNYQR